MNGASIIFYAVFVLPLIVFLIWLMRQDKRKGKIGIVVVIVLVVGVIVYMYFKQMFSLDSHVYAPGLMVW